MVTLDKFIVASLVLLHNSTGIVDFSVSIECILGVDKFKSGMHSMVELLTPKLNLHSMKSVIEETNTNARKE